MEKYDLIIIGGGPAGYAAAMRAIDFGKKVCLIEAVRVGGAGVYHGALSSKTLWEIANKVANVNDTIGDDGRPPYEIPWTEVRQTLDEAIFERKLQYSSHIKILQEESYKGKFAYERGFGSFVSDHEVLIEKNKGDKVVWGDYIIIATGSRPRYLKHIEVDEQTILTSNGIDSLDGYPESLVIVGAGVIGCEYATVFSNFGKTKVYLIDRAERILPFEDEDISKLVSENLIKRGVTIHHSASLKRLEKKNDKVEYELEYDDGRTEIIHVEKALLSIGRSPNIEKINLENAGVNLSKRGVHIGDIDTLTNIPHIYAVGDVSGRIALVNVAEIEARHAVEKIFARKDAKLSYDNVCTIMFLRPEVAAVGLNEIEAMANNIPIKVVKLDYSVIARAIAMRKTQGFFKIIVSNDEEMRILGMRAVGEHASTAIQGVALLVQMKAKIEELAELVHPHPSIVEGIQECVRMLLNKSLFKVSVFRDKLAIYSIIDGEKIPLDHL